MGYCPEQLRKLFTDNKWLPIKIHYFFMFGTVAGVWPFLPVIGKDLGLSATAVGITFTLQPIFIFLFKPLFGYLADYLQNIKIIVISLMTGTVILITIVIFIEPLQQTSYFNLEVYRQNINKTQIYRKRSSDFYEPCIMNLLTLGRVNCKISYQDTYPDSNLIEKNLQLEAEYKCVSNNTQPHMAWKINETRLSSTSLDCLILLKSNFSEMNEENYSLTECDNVFEECLASSTNPSIFTTYQFWIYTILLIAAGTFYTTSMSLTDVACYDILGEQKEYFGRQRLWGTIATGVVTLLSGYLNDLMARDEEKTEYLAGYYMMVVLFISNMIFLTKISLPKANLSKTIISDIRKLFQSLDIVIYSISVFLIGNFMGLVANYLFWYLKELGANQTILGLTITSQCLTAELPFFFFSGWVIKRLGYFNCLTCSFAAFSLRFGLYSLLRNPWLTLPIEILHGLTFAVFYASKTAFASVHAPPGTEGTFLGILGGLCDGLGHASGTFLGGLAFDRIGGSQTFLIASIISLLCVPVTFIAHFVFKKSISPKTITKG